MNYWMVKAAVLERQVRLDQLKAQVAEVESSFVKILTANGLDPQKNYRMNDADESVTEVSEKD